MSELHCRLKSAYFIITLHSSSGVLLNDDDDDDDVDGDGDNDNDDTAADTDDDDDDNDDDDDDDVTIRLSSGDSRLSFIIFTFAQLSSK